MKPRFAAFALCAVILLSFPVGAAAADDFADLAFEPHPGATLPLDTVLTDEQGRPAALGEYFTGKPVILVLEYLQCKTLCGVTLDGLITALDALPLDAGRDYTLVAISIDPRDTPAEAATAKAEYLARYTHPGGASSLHFLTGTELPVRQIADAVGFPYRYDPVLDQYIHPAGFVVAAPSGTISRYILGVGPSSAELLAALGDAAQGRALDPLTRLLLLCRSHGWPLGRYSVPVEAAFTLANVAGLAGLIIVFAAIRRRRHR